MAYYDEWKKEKTKGYNFMCSLTDYDVYTNASENKALLISHQDQQEKIAREFFLSGEELNDLREVVDSLAQAEDDEDKKVFETDILLSLGFDDVDTEGWDDDDDDDNADDDADSEDGDLNIANLDLDNLDRHNF